MPSTPRKVPSGHETKSSILYLHSLGVRPMMIVRLSGHPLVRDSLSSPRTGLQRRRVRRVYCLRRCKAGSPSNFMFLSNSVRLLHKCCTPWLPRPIMAFLHVSYECEKPGYSYVLPPSCANKPPIREARIQIQITFCAVEEAVLPRTPLSRGVDISSGRSRNMAHHRDRIPVRGPEEGV